MRAEAISKLHSFPPSCRHRCGLLLSSSLLHLWFSSFCSPWLLLSAALRWGVENKRYNALPSLAAPSPLPSPTLSCSPCTEHALLPVLSLKWDTLSSVWMNLRVAWHLTLIWEIVSFSSFSFALSAVSPPLSLQLLAKPSLSLSVIDCTSHFCLLSEGGAKQWWWWCWWGGGSVTCMYVCSRAWPCPPCVLVWLQWECVCSLSCQLCCTSP